MKYDYGTIGPSCLNVKEKPLHTKPASKKNEDSEGHSLCIEFFFFVETAFQL